MTYNIKKALEWGEKELRGTRYTMGHEMFVLALADLNTSAPQQGERKISNESIQFIASTFQRWIDFDTEARNKEGLETTDDTHIMSPPTWPSHGQLKNWIEALKSYQEGKL